MKIYHKFLYCCLIVALVCSCVKEPEISVKGLSFDTDSLTMAKDEMQTIEATISPENATNPKIIWTSSNKSIASVDNGAVKAVSEGTAVITAKTEDGGFTKTCTIKVNETVKHVTGIELRSEENKIIDSLFLKKGEEYTVIAKIDPDNASVKSVRWTSSDTTVFKVSEAGKITAINSGKATLTAYTIDGGLTADCKIIVANPAESISIEPEEITIISPSFKANKLTAKIEPADSDSKLIWESSNENIVSVDPFGNLTAASNEYGDAIVKVSLADNPKVSAECKIHVTLKITGLRFGSSTIYVKEGSEAKSGLIIFPEMADSKGIKWMSSDPGVATVGSDGSIKGVKNGKATLTASTDNGNIKATCTVQVISKVASIEISEKRIDLEYGKTHELKATIKPDYATFPDIRWSSSDPAVATVDSLGNVKAISVGSAVITAAACDGGFTAHCTVNVISQLKKLSIDPASIDLYELECRSIKVICEPEYATDFQIEWSSDNPKIVEVINGNLFAKKSGTATITAKSKGLTATCKVNVMAKISGIEISEGNLKLQPGENKKLSVSFTPLGIPEKDRTVQWTSSNNSVATVDGNGLVTAVNTGTAIISASCTQDEDIKDACTVTVAIPVKSFNIKRPDVALFKGGGQKLVLKNITPAGADVSGICWKSSKESVASIDAHGQLICNNPGEVTITAYDKDNTAVRDSITLNILCHVTTIFVEPEHLDLNVGDEKPIEINVFPDNATDKTYTLKSDNEAVATIKSGNIVVAKAKGSATITITSNENSKVTASCTVTVGEFVEISLNKKETSLAIGKTEQLIATITPSSASSKTVIWSSNDDSIATVNDNGLVTAKKEGKATITATAADGRKAECTVTVIPNVLISNISSDVTSKELYEGERFKINITLTPADATNPAVTWTSDNPAVATVDSNGNVEAVSTGQTKVTAKAEDGSGKSCSVTITVRNVIHVNRVEILDGKDEMYVGDIETFNVKVYPENASNSAIDLTLGTAAIRYVNKVEVSQPDKNGISQVTIKAVAATPDNSPARVSVCSKEDDEITTAIYITIKNRLVSNISLNRQGLTLKEGQSTTLTATVLPANATNKALTWKSSNPGIVSVSSNGAITAKSKGDATVTATANDGSGIKAECQIKVISSIIDNGTIEPVTFIDL